MRQLIRILFIFIITIVVYAQDNRPRLQLAPVEARESNALIAIKVRSMPDYRVRFDFIFAKPLTGAPSTFVTENPDRLAIDFVNIKNCIKPQDLIKKVGIAGVNQYRVIAVNHRVRTLFDLDKAIIYKSMVVGQVYSLIIKDTANALIPEKKTMAVLNRPQCLQFRLEALDFKGIERQGGRLVLNLNSPSVITDVKKKDNEMVLTLIKTAVAPSLRKRFDVADFHSPVQSIVVEQQGKNAVLTLQGVGEFDNYLYQVNNQVLVDIFPLSAEEIQAAKLKKKVFMGKRISFNFQDIPVRSVLQLIADFTGMNIVVSDKVTGSMTLRLNEVPWDQALDIILTTQGLDKRQQGNVMLIDTAAALSARENEALKEAESLKKLAPLRSELLQLNYAKATDMATMLKDKTNSLLSDRGALSVDVRTNTIWLQDTDEHIREVRELVKELDVPVRQVSIEARIVNMTKNCEEDIGVRWGISKPPHLSGTLEGANQLAQGVPPANVVPFTDRLNLDLAAITSTGIQPASVGLALAKLGDNVLLDLELSAMESQGQAEIIASPRLMTTNQQPAQISSGEDIPYQEATSSGATAVAFKQAVLSLKVTPQITPDNRLLMDLEINQDEDSGQRVQGVPIITTKSIKTNALVNNGQTIVLGGIYQQNKNNTIDRIPFLGNMPFVGGLFSRKESTVKNQELLIFITPRIITGSLSITAVGGVKLPPQNKVELDKFGNVVYPH